MHKYTKFILLLLFLIGGLFYSLYAQAASEGGETAAPHGVAFTFLWIAVILVIAKFSSLIERFGQPAVLGELVVGVIIGNLALIGIHLFEPIKLDPFITFLAQLGVVILLFQIGLESDIKDMRKVGLRAFWVACIGVIVPFVLGTYIVGPWLLPGLSTNTYLFLGAALVATSVGITARVFKDLGKLQSPEARITLGAAVFDDVLGLIILAVVSAIVTIGAVSIGVISVIVAKAILFLVGAIVVGHFFAPYIGKAFSKISPGIGMKFTLAVSFGLVFAFLAAQLGLAPIIGAFAAGLILDPVHFRFFRKPQIIYEMKEAIQSVPKELKKKIFGVMNRYSHRHIEDLIEPLVYSFVPIFFVTAGMAVNLETLFDPSILLVALGITVVAVVSKLVSGIAAGKVNKSIVGFGMVPRGEVGLIFATIGKSLGVVPDQVFSVIIIMIIFTTLLTPIALTFLLKRQVA